MPVVSIFEESNIHNRKIANYKTLIKVLIYEGGSTITELSNRLNLSVPTIAKLINDLVESGYVMEMGKRDNAQGRFPTIYDLTPASGYFLGVNPGHDSLSMALCDFTGECVHSKMDIPFNLTNTPECLEVLINEIKDYINELPIDKKKLLRIGMNISGRVNPFEGLSYSIFNFIEGPLASYFTKMLGYPTSIDNDTRAMAYGEYLKGSSKGMKDVIYVNMSWGIAIGIIINGELYFGKSGYSGEFGHVHAFNNELMCHCGKKGCLETEVSGMALLRETLRSLEKGEQSILMEKYMNDKDGLTLNDVVYAISKEDVLCIDALQKIADELGKNLAGIINIFNPEMLVIGGDLSLTGDYITQPVSMAIKKYSLNVVNEDSVIVTSTLKENAGVIGACMVARSRAVDLR